MAIPWQSLSAPERRVFQISTSFLQGRLTERETVEWALALGRDQVAEQTAVRHLLNHDKSDKLDHPWSTVWGLIEESWQRPENPEANQLQKHYVARRLAKGEKTGSIVTSIVSLVAPTIEVRPLSRAYVPGHTVPKRPKRVEHIVWAHLKSGDLVDPSTFGIEKMDDLNFLWELMHSLESSVNHGIDIGRRLGWDEKSPRFWILGGLSRAYYVPEGSRPTGEHEPDRFHHGIAPSVKLLHAVISRLGTLDAKSVRPVLASWAKSPSLIHTRLWAAVARDPAIVRPVDVAKYLGSRSSNEFWDANAFPEVAEVRALRFRGMSARAQEATLNRIRRGPPKSMWRRGTDSDRLYELQRFLTARELRRIELASVDLPNADKEWLASAIEDIDEIRNMSRVDDGFVGSPKARWVPPNPDERLDRLAGKDRLEALERSLSSESGNRFREPAERAYDWLRQPGRVELLLDDFESLGDQASSFPNLWEAICWAHSRIQAGAEPTQEETALAARAFRLLESLETSVLIQAIDGITYWLSNWGTIVGDDPRVCRFWLKLWPIAVERTNDPKGDFEDEAVYFDQVASAGAERFDFDTLNNPAGRLVGVFLDLCPTIGGDGDAAVFSPESDLVNIREAIQRTTGRSGLIAKYRLIESLRYFLLADREWTKAQLIRPLLADSSESTILWKAVARTTQRFDTLELIGRELAKRATDERLDRDARQSLAFSIVIQSLFAFLMNREPAVSAADVAQMLRSLEPEVRADAAHSIVRFVRENTGVKPEEHESEFTPERLFHSAAKPFLKEVWPLERSLTSPGVARALANLPQCTGTAFPDAVEAIERYLVPFECWSLGDFGFFELDNDETKLSEIDSVDTAKALMILLDRTIGEAEGAVVPYDLGRAIKIAKPFGRQVTEMKEFRRLAVLARR
jgi:hypothetical protein